MNTYDFDKTIFYPDSSFCFYRYCLRRYPAAVLPTVRESLRAARRYGRGELSAKALKEQVFSFLPQIPDIDRAAQLAGVYGVTLDSLMKTVTEEGVGILPPAPKGKNIWGTVTIGDRGQIVIPKAARDQLGMKSRDRLVVLSDEVGLALVPAELFERGMQELMDKLDIG